MNFSDFGAASRPMLHHVQRRFLSLGALAALLVCMAAPGMAAAEIAAKVDFVSGLVTASASGRDTRDLAKDDDIDSGDQIDTAENGRIQMRFTDGGLVSLMPQSTFAVNDYQQEGLSPEDGSLVFALVRGGMRTLTGTIGDARHDRYRVDTPVATLGIRGTEYVAVLNPPNTLRVHVGRGKVVITNYAGTLEVPAGRNAVATLNSAPQFAEQGPNYLAVAPTSHFLLAQGEIKQDPFLKDPLLDLPLNATITFADPPEPLPAEPEIGPTDPIIPAPEPTALPDGSGYGVSMVLNYSTNSNTPTTNSPGPTGLTAHFDGANGNLLSLDDPNGGAIVTENDFDLANVVTLAALSWGEFTNGSGNLNGAPHNLAVDEFQPYVVGLPTDAGLLPSGMLNYSLEGATVARDRGNTMGELAQFDLGVDLGSQVYTLDMRLDMANTTTYYANTGGALTSGAVSMFNFGTDQVTSNDPNCADYGCRMDVSGFLAGPEAKQAGVTYTVQDGQTEQQISGAAALKLNP